jgi:hypothetical protein
MPQHAVAVTPQARAMPAPWRSMAGREVRPGRSAKRWATCAQARRPARMCAALAGTALGAIMAHLLAWAAAAGQRDAGLRAAGILWPAIAPPGVSLAAITPYRTIV